MFSIVLNARKYYRTCFVCRQEHSTSSGVKQAPYCELTEKRRKSTAREREKLFKTMMQRFFSIAGRPLASRSMVISETLPVMHFSSTSTAVADDMQFVHHGHRPRYRDYVKFKSPRKRASKLFSELNDEACEKIKESNPTIWQDIIRVGDSVELRMVSQGGLKAEKQELEKIRGVVLGIVKRGLGSSLILRDVVYGLPIERRIPFYSPMIKEAKILERNFIFKGKKKVKRSKLYYFRDRNPLLTKVSKY